MTRIPPLARFEKSAERRAVEDRMRATDEGQFISYAEWSEVAGVQDIRKARHISQHARRTVLREGIVFDTVTDEGLKRADPVGALGIAQDKTVRSRNEAKRAGQVLHQIPTERLDPESKTVHTRLDVQIGLTINFLSSKGSRMIDVALAKIEGPEIQQQVMKQFPK